MDGSFYFYFGGALVLTAVVLSYIGIRSKGSFPPSGGALAGVATMVAAFVIGTAAYGIANAREEADHREHEEAEEDAASEQEGSEDAGAAPAAQEPSGVSEGGQPGGIAGEAQTLSVSSPEDGSLVFDPDGLDAGAGEITLAYENPSPIPHNVNIETEGQPVAESEDVTAGTVEVTAELAPGEYIYYCSIPGHRESGMEGTLTVE